jgi:hypothetical protein
MATSPDGFLARRFDAPDALPGTVAGRDIPSLVAAGRLDFEDEYFETSDGHWQPIWRFPGVSPQRAGMRSGDRGRPTWRAS